MAPTNAATTRVRAAPWCSNATAGSVTPTAEWREFLDWTEARGYALDVEWLRWEIERLEAGLGT
jgi:DNA-binding IclR family transcriptional regulator